MRVRYRDPRGIKLQSLTLEVAVVPHKFGPGGRSPDTGRHVSDLVFFADGGNGQFKTFHDFLGVFKGAAQWYLVHGYLPQLAADHLLDVFGKKWFSVVQPVLTLRSTDEQAKASICNVVLRCAETAFRQAIQDELPLCHEGGVLDMTSFVQAAVEVGIFVNENSAVTRKRVNPAVADAGVPKHGSAGRFGNRGGRGGGNRHGGEIAPAGTSQRQPTDPRDRSGNRGVSQPRLETTSQEL